MAERWVAGCRTAGCSRTGYRRAGFSCEAFYPQREAGGMERAPLTPSSHCHSPLPCPSALRQSSGALRNIILGARLGGMAAQLLNTKKVRLYQVGRCAPVGDVGGRMCNRRHCPSSLPSSSHPTSFLPPHASGLHLSQGARVLRNQLALGPAHGAVRHQRNGHGASRGAGLVVCGPKGGHPRGVHRRGVGVCIR